MKVDEIHVMYKKVYMTAQELVEDAKVLFEDGSYARAYKLAQVALQEYNKLNMLYAIALKIYNKDIVTFEEIAVRLGNENIDDDLGYGIMLLMEKDFIDYPLEIEVVMQQMNLEISSDLQKLEQSLSEDVLIMDILKAYKKIVSVGVLKDIFVLKSLQNHINSFSKNSLIPSFQGKELIMPSEVINRELSNARIMTVLVVQKIHEMTGYYDKKFDLFKFDKITS